MIFGVYTIRDEASGLFMAPQVSENNDVAIRSFDYAMQSNDLMKYKPEDFALYYVGDYDNTTGVLTAKDTIILKRGVRRNGKKA